jgi:hypothetical protein
MALSDRELFGDGVNSIRRAGVLFCVFAIFHNIIPHLNAHLRQ